MVVQVAVEERLALLVQPTDMYISARGFFGISCLRNETYAAGTSMSTKK